MLSISRYGIKTGINLSAAVTDNYQDAYICINLLIPAEKTLAAKCAALPVVLSQGTQIHQNKDALNMFFSGMHSNLHSGSSIIKGIQLISIGISYPETGLMKERQAAFGKACSACAQILFAPRTFGGRLYSDYIDRAKTQLIKAFMDYELTPEANYLCPVGEKITKSVFPLCGGKSNIEKLSVGTLTPFYKKLIASAAVEIVTVSSLPAEQMMFYVRENFGTLPEREKASIDPAYGIVRQSKEKKYRKLSTGTGNYSGSYAYIPGGENTEENICSSAIFNELFAINAGQDESGGVISKNLYNGEAFIASEEENNNADERISVIKSGNFTDAVYAICCERVAAGFLKHRTSAENLGEYIAEAIVCDYPLDPGNMAGTIMNTGRDKIVSYANALTKQIEIKFADSD